MTSGRACRRPLRNLAASVRARSSRESVAEHALDKQDAEPATCRTSALIFVQCRLVCAAIFNGRERSSLPWHRQEHQNDQCQPDSQFMPRPRPWPPRSERARRRSASFSHWACPVASSLCRCYTFPVLQRPLVLPQGCRLHPAAPRPPGSGSDGCPVYPRVCGASTMSLVLKKTWVVGVYVY